MRDYSLQTREDESLYNSWERFTRLLKICPMHGIDLTTHVDIFYHAKNFMPPRV